MISKGPPVAKALSENGPDGERRKLGERPGLDTLLVPAVNDVDFVSWYCKVLRCGSEGVKSTAWGVRSQD